MSRKVHDPSMNTFQEPSQKTLIQLTDGGYNPLMVWWLIVIKPLLTWRRPS